jgi:two-component system response regulator FixJ
MRKRQTIYLVDDEPAVRRSLARLLDSAGYDVLSFESPRSFLVAAPGLNEGCVLLDIRMPEINGLEVLEHLHQGGIILGVVVVTAHGDVRTAVNAMKAGAVDFIEKPFNDDQLFLAINDALAATSRRSSLSTTKEARRQIGQLTPREDEVLTALAAGMTTKMIAYKLGISIRTVEAHRSRMLERLGTKRLAKAIRMSVLANLG